MGHLQPQQNFRHVDQGNVDARHHRLHENIVDFEKLGCALLGEKCFSRLCHEKLLVFDPFSGFTFFLAEKNTVEVVCLGHTSRNLARDHHDVDRVYNCLLPSEGKVQRVHFLAEFIFFLIGRLLFFVHLFKKVVAKDTLLLAQPLPINLALYVINSELSCPVHIRHWIYLHG